MEFVEVEHLYGPILYTLSSLNIRTQLGLKGSETAFPAARTTYQERPFSSVFQLAKMLAIRQDFVLVIMAMDSVHLFIIYRYKFEITGFFFTELHCMG